MVYDDVKNRIIRIANEYRKIKDAFGMFMNHVHEIIHEEEIGLSIVGEADNCLQLKYLDVDVSFELSMILVDREIPYGLVGMVRAPASPSAASAIVKRFYIGPSGNMKWEVGDAVPFTNITHKEGGYRLLLFLLNRFLDSGEFH